MTRKRCLQAALVPIPLDGHAQDVRRALQKSQILFDELAIGTAVDLEDAERLAVALQDHVHCAPNAVALKQLRRPEPLFIFQMIGDDGLARAQGETSR